MSVALAHDYLTQRGGAERVAVTMARAFPGAPMYTTLYDPAGTFPEIGDLDVHASSLNRWPLLRSHHRAALPFLSRAVSAMQIDADLLIASSSGWAHGISCTGRKVVYCHAPARWLYQESRYLGAGRDMSWSQRARREASSRVLRRLGGPLRQWDQAMASTADRYLVNSTVVRRAVREVYGIEAEVVPPPPALVPSGVETSVPSLQTPFLLCVARLLPYKNVDVVIEAAAEANIADLVVVGTGPDRPRLHELARRSSNVHLLGQVSDDQLRWLYRHCWALVAASFEDYGLSPLEAAAFGRPSVALRDGGFLDTIAEGRTGIFFDAPTVESICGGLTELSRRTWDERTITAHADSFSEERFVARLQAIADEELAMA